MIFALSLYLIYAFLAPSLPLAWPVPPLDLVLLVAALSPHSRVSPQRLVYAFLAIDVILGQPQIFGRWLSWFLVWLGLRAGSAGLGSLLLVSLLWYASLGPRLDWFGAAAVAFQSCLLFLWWTRPQRPASQAPRGWGWHGGGT